MRSVFDRISKMSLSADVTKVMLLNSDTETIRAFAAANKETVALLTDDNFWQQLLEAKFGKQKRMLGVSWRNTFEILSTPMYQAMEVYSHHGVRQPDIEMKSFAKFDDAVEHCITAALMMVPELEPKVHIDPEENDFSDRFYNIIMNYEFEKVLGIIATTNDKDLMEEYTRYEKMCRDKLRDLFLTGHSVCDANHRSCVRIIKTYLTA